MATAHVLAVTLVTSVLVTYAHLLKYRMYLRAVTQYHDQVGDHKKTIEFAEAVRPTGSTNFGQLAAGAIPTRRTRPGA